MAARIHFRMWPFFNLMKKHIATLIIAAGVLTAFADSSTNNVTTAVKKPKWESSVGVGFTLTRGNSDTILVTANFLTQKKDPITEWTFGADGAYGENKVQTTIGTNTSSRYVENNESLHVFGQYNHLFSERLFGYARTEGLHDGIADLSYRFTISPGAGYYFLKYTNTTLAGEIGPGLTLQELGGVDSTYATLRLAERFEHKFAEHARLWQSLELLPQINKFNNYLVNAEIGVEAPLSKKLSLQTYLDDNYVNEPAAGRKANDVKLVGGIAYKF
jgi:putative salt-induced outer membrane protein YdiY